MMPIKFVDLAAQTAEIRDRVDREFEEIHARAAYVSGFHVNAFEREFASFLGVKNVVAVSSGTDALRLALLALGVGPGDEVITVPMTFIATAAAIVQTGARPVFVDVDHQSGNMSVAELERYLEQMRFSTPNGPKAVIPVDLYGLPAPIARLRDITERWGLKLVEDACQAHGARLSNGNHWIRAGTQADIGCFSFYPGKNLGAWGDGGAIATNNEESAARVCALRDHGRISHYRHSEWGYNARLDAMQAAVLRAKLECLDEWNDRRRLIAARYCELLCGVKGLELPVEPEESQSCYHLYVVRSIDRDRIRQELQRNEIESGIHYPLPLHLQPACKSLGYRLGDFPMSERMAATVLSLPIHPHMTPDQVESVARTISQYSVRASPARSRLRGASTSMR
jgi:dTDP-4-amino-4,6-dideoxygalactose transaminase